MTWKDFFKPDKTKIICSLLVLILLTFVFFHYIVSEDNNSCDDFTSDAGNLFIFYLPLILLTGLFNSLVNLSFSGDYCITSFNKIGIPPPGILIFIGLLLELIYIYTIICIISYIFAKLKKKSNQDIS